MVIVEGLDGWEHFRIFTFFVLFCFVFTLIVIRLPIVTTCREVLCYSQRSVQFVTH